MANLRDVIYAFMPPEEQNYIDDFGCWAFGYDFKELSHTNEFMKQWNKLHGEQFFLNATGLMHEDIPQMLELWRNEKEN